MKGVSLKIQYAFSLAVAAAIIYLSVGTHEVKAQEVFESPSFTTWLPGSVCQPKYATNHRGQDHWYYTGKIQNASTEGVLYVTCPLPLHILPSTHGVFSKVEVTVHSANPNQQRPLGCYVRVRSFGGAAKSSKQIIVPYADGLTKAVTLELRGDFSPQLLVAECTLPPMTKDGRKPSINGFQIKEHR